MSSIAYRVVFTGDPPVGALEFVSDACAALIGLSAAAIVERPHLWLQAIHDEDREAFVQTTAQLIADGAAVTRHYRVRGGNGAYQLIEDRLAASVDVNGDVIGYESVIVKPS